MTYSGTGNQYSRGGYIEIQEDPSPKAGINPANGGDWNTEPGTVYSGPHYLDQNHNGQQDAGDRQFPIGYRRNSTPTLEVAIWVEKNEFLQPFRIKGTGGWNINLNPTAASAADAGEGNGSKIVTATITSTTPLLDQVQYTPGLQVNWKVKADDDSSGWTDAGSSQNEAYLTFDYPLNWQLVPIYHTVIHLGSYFAAGQTTRDGTVDKAWEAFGTNAGTANEAPANTKNVNNQPLHYYKLYEPLSHFLPGLLAYKDGTCGAWAYLWGATLMAQGIDSTLTEVTAAAPYDGFLIKNWNTGGAAGPYTLWAANLSGYNNWSYYNAAGNGYAFDAASTLADATGIAGQNTTNPASWFDNHALVQYTRAGDQVPALAGTVVYYDPSYGKTWANAAAMDATMFGYYKNKYGGVIGIWPYMEVTANPAGNQLVFTPAQWLIWP